MTFYWKSSKEENGKYIFKNRIYRIKFILSCNYQMSPLDLFISLRYIMLVQHSRNYIIITH